MHPFFSLKKVFLYIPSDDKKKQTKSHPIIKLNMQIEMRSFPILCEALLFRALSSNPLSPQEGRNVRKSLPSLFLKGKAYLESCLFLHLSSIRKA